MSPPTAPAIGVLGLWHLGSVTAACLAAAGNEVVGIDPDPTVVAGLAKGSPPVFEPGLGELIAANATRLHFAADANALTGLSRAWVAFDTPVDEEDRADVEWVIEHAARLLAPLAEGALVIVSSQLPAGSLARLRARCVALHGERGLRFACIPENLRLGGALEAFRAPARIVAGVSSEQDRRELAELLAPFTANVLWTRVESAEMLKHALNGFLATSIAFANEVACICESVGADAAEVAQGLKSDPRIGPRAYLDPGEAFAGGTLARDIGYLRTLAEHSGLEPHVSEGVAAANATHRHWTRRRLLALLGMGDEHAVRPLAGLTIAVWGLAYKPGTDTLRRSGAIELCRWLAQAGARVRGHDPAVHALPASLAGVLELCPTPLEAASGARALVVCTACPEFRAPSVQELLAALQPPEPLILDPAGWLANSLMGCEDVRYARVGTPPHEGQPPHAAPLAEAIS